MTIKALNLLPIARNAEPSVMLLLELMAYVSDVKEDILDMDMVSNFISAAMLLMELDSIMDDIMACWAEEEEKEEDSCIACISFFIIMDELTDELTEELTEDSEDSLRLIAIDPDRGRHGNG